MLIQVGNNCRCRFRATEAGKMNPRKTVAVNWKTYGLKFTKPKISPQSNQNTKTTNYTYQETANKL